MPRSLVSRPFKVAQSGPCIDGRTIEKQDIIDMAETYDPKVYTANIFIEHERWMDSLGTVYRVFYQEEENGELGLYAQVRPNDYFLELNDKGVKLFPSIEITPNFANTNKAYLSGLAATDSPASLGTEEFYFSNRAKNNAKSALMGCDSAIPNNIFNRKPKSRISKIFSRKKPTFNQLTEVTMTPEQLAQLLLLLQAVSGASNSLSDFYDEIAAQEEPTLSEEQSARFTELNQALVAATNAVTDFQNSLASGEEPEVTPPSEPELNNRARMPGTQNHSKKPDQLGAVLSAITGMGNEFKKMSQAFNTATGQGVNGPKGSGTVESAKPAKGQGDL